MHNNVTRFLDARKITYQVYKLPGEKISALETAGLLGVAPDRVFKTIVITRSGKGKPILAVVPASSTVDLKSLAKVVGEKKLSIATKRQAEQLTGLRAGGISPLALLNRGFQVVLDTCAGSSEYMHISGGEIGLNIRLPFGALVELTKAITADICEKQKLI
jgi:Cys-tRNA(Pro)/Cys-tRNA(Cys) deacylase